MLWRNKYETIISIMSNMSLNVGFLPCWESAVCPKFNSGKMEIKTMMLTNKSTLKPHYYTDFWIHYQVSFVTEQHFNEGVIQ